MTRLTADESGVRQTSLGVHLAVATWREKPDWSRDMLEWAQSAGALAVVSNVDYDELDWPQDRLTLRQNTAELLDHVVSELGMSIYIRSYPHYWHNQFVENASWGLPTNIPAIEEELNWFSGSTPSLLSLYNSLPPDKVIGVSLLYELPIHHAIEPAPTGAATARVSSPRVDPPPGSIHEQHDEVCRCLARDYPPLVQAMNHYLVFRQRDIAGRETEDWLGVDFYLPALLWPEGGPVGMCYHAFLEPDREHPEMPCPKSIAAYWVHYDTFLRTRGITVQADAPELIIGEFARRGANSWDGGGGPPQYHSFKTFLAMQNHYAALSRPEPVGSPTWVFGLPGGYDGPDWREWEQGNFQAHRYMGDFLSLA